MRVTIAILGFAVIALLASLCFAQSPSASQQDEITRRITEYLNRATDSGLFSGSVAVAKDGKIVFSRGYGMASLAYDVPNGPQTRFDIGSVSKTFTAALVLWLQDSGKLRVDDPICKYLDNCPDAWRSLTIRHLLTHTSGIRNYTELPDYFENRALESFLPNAMKQIREMPLQFVSGERFAYSNTGYLLLHEIVQKVSGQTDASFLHSKILDPLGMRNTGFLESPNIRHTIVKNLATGFGATLVLYFDQKLTIFVASNLDTAPTNRVEEDIAKIIFEEPYELPPTWRAVTIDAKIYDGYVGRYRKTDQPNFVITIKKENGQLWNRLGDEPGAAEMVLRPLSETRFFNKMFVLYDVTFVLGEQGRATKLLADGPWGHGEFVRID